MLSNTTPALRRTRFSAVSYTGVASRVQGWLPSLIAGPSLMDSRANGTIKNVIEHHVTRGSQLLVALGVVCTAPSGVRIADVGDDRSRYRLKVPLARL